MFQMRVSSVESLMFRMQVSSVESIMFEMQVSSVESIMLQMQVSSVESVMFQMQISSVALERQAELQQQHNIHRLQTSLQVKLTWVLHLVAASSLLLHCPYLFPADLPGSVFGVLACWDCQGSLSFFFM